MNHHIHVYLVAGLREYDFKDCTETEALQRALDNALDGRKKFKQADCVVVALSPSNPANKTQSKPKGAPGSVFSTSDLRGGSR